MKSAACQLGSRDVYGLLLGVVIRFAIGSRVKQQVFFKLSQVITRLDLISFLTYSDLGLRTVPALMLELLLLVRSSLWLLSLAESLVLGPLVDCWLIASRVRLGTFLWAVGHVLLILHLELLFLLLFSLFLMSSGSSFVPWTRCSLCPCIFHFRFPFPYAQSFKRIIIAGFLGRWNSLYFFNHLLL